MSARTLPGLILLLVGASGPLGAQARAPSDSTTKAYHDEVIAIRDSLRLVMADIQGFRRDLQHAGNETVLARADRAARRCESATAFLSRAQSEIRPPTRAAASLRDAARAYVGALRDLQRTLAQECVQGLSARGPGMHADTLRAWGAYRTSQLERAFARHAQAANRFARAAGFRIEPRTP